MVLIVDGDADFLENLRISLEKLQQFQVLTATDGNKALECLKTENVAIFVTDIQTPELDCLELLSYMSCNHPRVPCIVTTDWGKPWFKNGMAQQTFLYHLEKPFSASAMAAAIFVGLNLRDEGLHSAGMTMASLLPLVDLQQKTCRMEILSSGTGKGYLYFEKGVLFDAHYKTLNGEEAAREISSWNRISFALSELPRHRTRRRVKTNLMDIADASWRKEEVMREAEDPKSDSPESEPVIPLHEESTPFELDWERAGSILQTFLSDIKVMPGYLSFALADSEGKVLTSDQGPESVNFRILARDLPSLFGSVQKTAGKLGIEVAEALTLHASNCTIILQLFQMNLFIMIACTREGKWPEIKTYLDNMISSLNAA